MRTIYFIGPNSASYHLRGRQVGEELTRLGYTVGNLLLDHYPKWISDANENLKDSIIVLVKPVTKLDGFMIFDLLRILKKNNNILICDLIEPIYFIVNPIWQDSLKYYDAIIVPNDATKEDIKIWRSNIIVKTIHHHWDARLTPQNPAECNFLHSGTPVVYYSSVTKNCLYLDLFKDEMTIVGDINQEEKKDYAYHYSIRSPESEEARYKSNIKLSNAAALGSNIVVTLDESFKDYLPLDYPYLTTDKEEDVKKMMQYAKETYKTPIWEKGLSIMSDIREKTKLSNIVKDYIDLFNALS